MTNKIIEDENHQGVKRIFGVPMPRRGDDAVNKWYCDANAGTGSSIFLDGGHPDTDYTDGPSIDCGGVT